MSTSVSNGHPIGDDVSCLLPLRSSALLKLASSTGEHLLNPSCSDQLKVTPTEVHYQRSWQQSIIRSQHDCLELHMSSRIDTKAPRRALSYWGVIAPPLTAAGKELVQSTRRPLSKRSNAKTTSGKPRSSYWGVIAPALTAAGEQLVLANRNSSSELQQIRSDTTLSVGPATHIQSVRP